MKVEHFKSAADFRAWLVANHSSVRELWVGFYKKTSGKGGITYDEALDEALCFGWIDGLKKRVDEFSYTHRFSPRKPQSKWSQINIRRVKRLKKAGRMAAPGLTAYDARVAYSFQIRPQTLAAADERRFKADKAAWRFFQQQPPGQQRLAIWWITSAKKDDTRARRLAHVIEKCRSGRRLGKM